FSLRGSDFRAGRVFVPRVQPAHHLDVRVRLSVRARTGVLRPLTEGLVVGARAIFRHRARLAVDLHRAFALIFERGDHVAFVMALEHARAPHPVEEHGLQVFGILWGCVRLSSPGAWIRILRTGVLCCQRLADREYDSDRDPYPTIPSTKSHGFSP